MLVKANCAVCGKEFIKVNPRHYLCSEECRNKNTGRIQAERRRQNRGYIPCSKTETFEELVAREKANR